MKSKFFQSSREKVFMYVDGGIKANPGDAGVGIYIVYPDFQHQIALFVGQGTNNYAELKAIDEGLKELIREKKTKSKVVLYSDSKYSIGVLNNEWDLKANKTLIRQVKSNMSKFIDLRMFHVKGHSGIHGNEKADKLAFYGKNKRNINRKTKNKKFI
jgi:ribonuclease HI